MPPVTQRNPHRIPGFLSILTSLTCWLVFFLWFLGVWVRSGGSRGGGTSLEL